MTLVGVGHVALNVGLYPRLSLEFSALTMSRLRDVLVIPNRRILLIRRSSWSILSPNCVFGSIRLTVAVVTCASGRPRVENAGLAILGVVYSCFAGRLTPRRLENVPANCTSIFGTR